MADLFARLAAAPERARQATSDFDLNPGIVLPEGRVLKPASVLIGVDDAGHLLLTQRSARLQHHPGQIAFPGGRQDPEDADAVVCALREAQEEVGLPRDAVEVLGTLPAHETVTSYTVTPVLARIKPFDPVPEAGEVAEVFRVPLAHVTDPARFRVQSRRWKGMPRYYYTVPWGPYYIWGATARMLRALAEAMA
ncbi:MAG: coenzyme A pyrophosphatase [Rhodobacterales bacterium]|nr:MAG: coenzyme A pyrophosphatase [Rhodobacterales bacterium]